MDFASNKDKQMFLSIVEHLKRLVRIEQLEQQKSFISESINSFYFYGEGLKKFDKPISSRTLGKSSVEYASTEAYTKITPETIQFDKSSVAEKPIEHQDFVNNNHPKYRFVDMYSEFDAFNIERIIKLSIALGVFLSIALFVLLALSLFDVFSEGSGIIKFLSFVKATQSWDLYNKIIPSEKISGLILLCLPFVFVYGIILSIISFAVVFLISVPIKIIQASKMNKRLANDVKEENNKIQNYNSQADSYNNNLDERNEIIVKNAIVKEIAFLQKWAQLFRNNMDKVADLNDLSDETNKELKTLKAKCEAFVNSGIIHKEYATNPVALYRMVDYF